MNAIKISLESLLKEYSSLPEYSDMENIGVFTRSLFGDFPINIAATRGILEEVKELTLAGADVNASGEHGYTPLHNATEQGHVEIVRYLLSEGADYLKKNDEGITSSELARLLEKDVLVDFYESFIKDK